MKTVRLKDLTREEILECIISRFEEVMAFKIKYGLKETTWEDVAGTFKLIKDDYFYTDLSLK